MPRPLTLALCGFAVLGAAVLGAYVYDRVSHGPPPMAGPTPAATPRPAPPTAPDPGGVPGQRPAFSLADLDGRVHPISEWDGKALIVNFWATWCAPCRREIPLLNRIQHEYAAKGFEVVGIAVDVASDVKAYVHDVPLDYPLLVGEQDATDAARDFGVNALAFPFTVFTDTKGRIVTLHLGELHEATAQAILAIVARLDAGTLTLDEARAAVREALAASERTPPTNSG